MKKFAREFRDFISKGNVIDLAVAVIIGGAFGKIVTALVNDIIMPLVGLATGGVSFTNKFLVLGSDAIYATLAEAKAAGASVFAYGDFIQTIIDFLIIALCIFMILKIMLGAKTKAEELLKKKQDTAQASDTPAVPAETTDDILKDIRALLKKQEENK